MRTATNKKVSANTNKSTSKSIKPTVKKITPSKVVKPNPKSEIEKPNTQVKTPSSTPIPSPIKIPNKQSQLIALLKDPKGADIKMLMQATGWQAHSIRGVISGVLKKKLGMNIVSSKVDGTQHYRIEHLTAA
ncbi:DUF3489 domain-containing protein [Polynucleobacter sp. 78F-HAINBA]|jgi:hypothetical protein|uniref:DUF3489 domain-containing protein n=1 Tax=Polynucleobacter sp. 78F-HAINBA TaxID=2689099 RepID=UPI001C0AC7B6|nr:DUF3489 domain-containing protein [Polynucleobacter sp. 78F-HAINBA]MBU3590439.1 DUF3489 domain-containing protein [Polynucleobacter sp. 78F-HAINBA]